MIEERERQRRDPSEIFQEDLAVMPYDSTKRFPAINLRYVDEEILVQLSENPGAPVAKNIDGIPIQNVAKITYGETEIIPIVDIHRNARGEYSVIHHGIEIQTLPGVVIVPMRVTPSGTPEFFVINQQRRFLEPSLHSTRDGANACFPQGKIEKKETIHEAVHRELLQETGLSATKIITLGTKYIHQSYGQGIADFELAIVPYEEALPDENLLEPDEEISAYGWMSEEQINALDLISMDQRMTSAARFIRWFLHESDGQYEELITELAQEEEVEVEEQEK